MDKRNITRNIRSNQVVDGSPKLPTAEQILHGEIAINFAKEHETLSLKNDNDEIVAFELRSVSNLNEKLNKEIERAQTAEQVNATAITTEEARASQKEKEISDLLGTKTDTKDKDTAFGRIAKEINDRTNAINSLDATVGATSVESGKHVAVQVVETDGKLTALTVTENDIASAAALIQEISDRQGAIAQEVTDRNTAIENAINNLKTNLDENVNDLTNKIIEDELVTANSISALADSAGLVTIDNEIKYVKKAKPYYIAEAETLADAINLLDDRIKLIEGLIDTKIKKAIYDLIKVNPTLVNPYDSNTSNA